MLRQSAWAAASAVILTASRFALSAIMARRLSQSAFGQYAYGQWMIDVAFLVCSLGVTGAASRFLVEYKNKPELLAAFVRKWRPWAFGLPWLTGAVVVAGAWLSNLNLTPVALVMLVLWAIASGLWAMQTAALVGMQRFDLVFFANAIAGVVMLGGVWALPLDPASPGMVFALMGAACSCAALVGFSKTGSLVKDALATSERIEPTRWRVIRLYALNMWLTALLWSLVWSRGEFPIVRSYLGDAGVAHYTVALALFGGAVQAVMLGVSGVAQHLTRLWGEGQFTEAVAIARDIMDAQLLLCTLGGLSMICLGPEMVTLLFGQGYRDSAAPLALLGFGLLGMAVSCQNHVLQIATDARFNRNTTLLGLLTLFGLAFVLIPRFGLAGAAAARAGTMLLLTAISIGAIVKRFGMASMSVRNVLVSTSITGLVAGFTLSRDSVALLGRALMLVTSVTIVVALLRGRNDQLLCLSWTRSIWSRIRRTARIPE
jgi:O-antigen/teichoic acid export membrane protein